MQSDLLHVQDLSGLTRAELLDVAKRQRALLEENGLVGNPSIGGFDALTARRPASSWTYFSSLESSFLGDPMVWRWETDPQHRFTQLINDHSGQVDTTSLGQTRWELLGVDAKSDPLLERAPGSP